MSENVFGQNDVHWLYIFNTSLKEFFIKNYSCFPDNVLENREMHKDQSSYHLLFFLLMYDITGHTL